MFSPFNLFQCVAGILCKDYGVSKWNPRASRLFLTCIWFHFSTFHLLSSNSVWKNINRLLLLSRTEPGTKHKLAQCDPYLMLQFEGWGLPHVLPSPPIIPTQSVENYRFSQPEVNTIHLHQGEVFQRGFLPDLDLHLVTDVSGPNHLEAQRLAPGRRDKGAPEVDAVSSELCCDHRSGR